MVYFGYASEGPMLGAQLEQAMGSRVSMGKSSSREERQKILDHLGDASEEELAFVQAELDAPIDVAGLAAAAGESAKAQVYSAALMAITRSDSVATRRSPGTRAGDSGGSPSLNAEPGNAATE